MIIYKVTNKLNGKSYIGQTKCTVAERIKRHIYGRSKIGRAIIEDGEENFDISVIDNADTQKELDELERYWIAFYNTCETGYNTLIGGKPTRKEFELLHEMSKKAKQNWGRKKEKERIKILEKNNNDHELYKKYMTCFGNQKYFPFPESGELSEKQRRVMRKEIRQLEKTIKSFYSGGL